jgi:hypothetical protein
MANSYIVMNGPMVTTAAPAKVTTAAVIKTLLQLKSAVPIKIIEWGISFDGTSAATPGVVELVDTAAINATVTALAAADVAPWNNANAPANTAGTGGTPLNLGTAASGYTASAEGTIEATRELDLQLIAPTGQYVKQFPLGREPELLPGAFLRVRVTFGAAINCLTYILFEV